MLPADISMGVAPQKMSSYGRRDESYNSDNMGNDNNNNA
jgi:hypothetical protein